jgi:hypothetical protein
MPMIRSSQSPNAGGPTPLPGKWAPYNPSSRMLSSQQDLWHTIRRPLAIVALSIFLGLMGSFDLGHAILANNAPGKVQGVASIANPHPNIGTVPSHTPAQNQPGLTTNSTPTPVATLPAQPTPTPTPQPTPTPMSQPTPTSTSPATGVAMVVHDNFVRSSDPAPWGSVNGYAWKGDVDSTDIFSVSNRQGVVTNADGFYSAVIGPTMKNSTVLVSATMSNEEILPDGNLTSISALLRWKNNDNWYKAYIDGTTLGIRRDVGGQTKTLATMPFVAQPNHSYTIRFRITGSTLQVRVWQTDTPESQNWMLQVTDTSLSSGLGGVRLGILKDMQVYITSFTEFRG